MKTKIAVYWPLVVVLALAMLAALKSYGGDEWHAPLRAAEVSSELARTVSYGLIGEGPEQASSAVPRVVAAESPRAS